MLLTLWKKYLYNFLILNSKKYKLMKKLKTFISILITLVSGFFVVNASSYSFTYFPVDDFDYYTKNLSNWMEVLKYSWETDETITKVDMSDIENDIKAIWYFKYFRISYYWEDSAFDELRNSDLDFTNLAGYKLDYPIVQYYLWDYLVVMIYNQLLTSNEKEIIWNYYNYDGIEFTKKWKWYKTKIKVDEKYYKTYDSIKYYNIYKKFIKSFKVTTFQIWQNPFDKYEIDNISNDLLQIEILNWYTIKGIILSLSTIWESKNVIVSWWSTYWKQYQFDQAMYENFYEISSAISYFYKIVWEMPLDLWSLFPNFLDITSINKYSHKLKYEIVDDFCYKIGFVPKSVDFKNQYSSYIDVNWYLFSNYCVR